MSSPCIEINELIFAYVEKPRSRPAGSYLLDGTSRNQILAVDSLTVQTGERVLCCGINGAGKSTLLSIIGGRKLVLPGSATIHGRDCFRDCTLGSTVCYLGDWWRTDFFLDLPIGQFLGESVCKTQRCREMCDILHLDLNWRISQLSDGQRRRCQILSAFTASELFEVYILDEITTDLDIVSRERLLTWLKKQSVQNKITVIYATHILDALDEWATRVIYMEDGKVCRDVPVTPPQNLYKTIRGWMMDKYGIGY